MLQVIDVFGQNILAACDILTCCCRYLDLVNAMEMVHLRDSTGAVLSLPPLTNSELSKVYCNVCHFSI